MLENSAFSKENMILNVKSSRKKVFIGVFVRYLTNNKRFRVIIFSKQLNPRKMSIFVDFEGQEDHSSTQNR